MQLLSISEREKILNDELKRIVKIIKNKYSPEKIILFGSMAKGEIHEWSDIDLLIIKETDARPIDRCVEIARLTRPKVGIDLFVYTSEEFNSIIKEGFSFFADIMKHSMVLYEKRNRRVA